MTPGRYSDEDRAMLLELARQAMDETLRHGRLPHVAGDHVPPGFGEPRACFVTLTQRGALRGCVGTLAPRWPLYRAVMENARSAATRDSRFEPVSLAELPELIVEISVLSQPRRLRHDSTEELLDRLRPGIDGVILSSGRHSATYLPQVWNKLPGKEPFLASLCRKAGLPEQAWRDPATRVETYTVESFEEQDPVH
ncbi:MAG: AmmeMemoRadiSam system protein A [Verrucomicrobiales bacterium]|nr:AmmeMemoRadiSam system protein A [Verrucomicrobiales bacterium]